MKINNNQVSFQNKIFIIMFLYNSEIIGFIKINNKNEYKNITIFINFLSVITSILNILLTILFIIKFISNKYLLTEK